MRIRRAEEKDMVQVHHLLNEVLEIHARIRPDIFISGTTKYTDEELLEIFRDDNRPVFVAVDEKDQVLGYAFCAFQRQPFSTNMRDFKTLYIDDLCVDQKSRGHGTGKALYQFVCDFARKNGCYDITLNVWEGNDSARAFYDRMGLKVKETTLEHIL